MSILCKLGLHNWKFIESDFFWETAQVRDEYRCQRCFRLKVKYEDWDNDL